MSAVTVAPPVPHWQKGVQFRQRQERGRGAVALHDPSAWTVGIIVATGLALIARHPIARAIGTEMTAAPVDVTSSAPSVPAARTTRVPTLALPVAAAPTHAPVDPFRALVTAGGKLLAPVPLTPQHRATTAQRPTQVTPPAAAGSCAGSTLRVAPGDTLWTIAARAVRSNDSGRVTVAWHRVYDVNRAVVGPDPAVLRVGTTLCVPTSLSQR